VWTLGEARFNQNQVQQERLTSPLCRQCIARDRGLLAPFLLYMQGGHDDIRHTQLLFTTQTMLAYRSAPLLR
jgi:hypothetical protein